MRGWIIGKARRRAAPRVVNSVNRNLESLTIHLLVNVVRGGKEPWERNKLGRRSHEPKVVAMCCMLMIFLNKTYDEIESYCKINSELHRLLGTSELPGHSVMHRGMKKLSTSYVRWTITRVIFKYRRQGLTVAVDGTGFSLSSSSKWFDIRVRRTNTRHDFLKLHIAIDVETGLIQAFTITEGKAHDSPEFKRLLRYLPRIAKCLGDSAYSSRKNCEIVVEKGGKPYLKFKVNATGRAKTSPGWRVSFREYKKDSEHWLAEYHLRSIIESVFGSIKKRWHSFLKSKLGWIRRKELALKVLAYNLKQVLYLKRADEIGIPLRTPITT